MHSRNRWVVGRKLSGESPLRAAPARGAARPLAKLAQFVVKLLQAIPSQGPRREVGLQVEERQLGRKAGVPDVPQHVEDHGRGREVVPDEQELLLRADSP